LNLRWILVWQKVASETVADLSFSLMNLRSESLAESTFIVQMARIYDGFIAFVPGGFAIG
jgi:hypothetical protein